MITHCFPLYNTLCDLGICLEGAAGDAVLAAGEVEARRIDRLLNRYSPVSALSRLSREYRPHVPYAVDGELWGVLAVCERFRQLTGGAFHMATGSISDLWDFGGTAPRRPPPEQLREQVDNIARCRIDMDREEKTISLSEPGILFDLGGAGKGYAVERVAALLQGSGASAGYVNFGGNLFAWGNCPGAAHSGWVTGIQHPGKPRGHSICRVLLKNSSISTSAGYDRFFQEGDHVWHHILDPRLGLPVQTDLASATVITPSAMEADILSTSCFLLGSKKAGELLAGLPETGGIFVLRDGHVETAGSLQPQLLKTE